MMAWKGCISFSSAWLRASRTERGCRWRTSERGGRLCFSITSVLISHVVMLKHNLRLLLCASLCVCASALIAGGQERDVAAEFKVVKGPLTAQLRGKRANRLEAVKKLEAYPTPDAAKLLLHQGMGSNDEEVARASFDALVKFSGDKEVSAFL